MKTSLELSPTWKNVTLLWSGYEYPYNGTDYEAIDFSQYNQDCFQPLSGPYTHIPDTLVYVGQLNGTSLVASICPRDPGDPDGPSGHGCGRNSYRNAMVVSNPLKTQLASAMPKPGLILYMEFLANKYKPKNMSLDSSPQQFYYKEISDLSQLRPAEVERISEEETRFLMEYSEFLELASGEPTPAPALDIPQKR